MTASTSIYRRLADLIDKSSSDESDAFLHGNFDRGDLAIIRAALAIYYMPPDIQAKLAALRGAGFSVGPRNPKLNTDYAGLSMVVQFPDEWDGEPTKDGANGPWCIVSNDLTSLVVEAYDVWGHDIARAALESDT